mgnify:CR=1 FL=1
MYLLLLLIMNIVLPEDIVEHIISFTIDRRGYNVYHYNIRKRLNWNRMERIVNEIKYFTQWNYSISWLKPSAQQKRNSASFRKSLKDGRPRIVYHTGCFHAFGQAHSAYHREIDL